MEHQLARWLKAGLVSEEQATRIRAFEASRRRPVFLYGVAGLGGLAIAVGLVSIVAANWDAIPARLKIGIDLGLVAALGAAVLRWERRGPQWLGESALVVMYGLVLASVALVGQVYQLGGEPWEALAVWSALTAVLMSRARSSLAALLWVAGLQVSLAAAIIHLLESSDRLQTFYASTLFWVPLICIGVSHHLRARHHRSALSDVLAAVGWAEVLLCATIGTFAFYGDSRSEQWAPMFAGAAVSVGLSWWAIRGLPRDEAWGPRVLLLAACGVLAHLPWPISPGDFDLIAALAFIALWLGTAFTAYRGRQANLLNAATAVVGVRIIAVYFEVFGSLLDTGLGLVVGGALTLGVVWLWARKRREFESELAEEGGER